MNKQKKLFTVVASSGEYDDFRQDWVFVTPKEEIANAYLEKHRIQSELIKTIDSDFQIFREPWSRKSGLRFEPDEDMDAQYVKSFFAFFRNYKKRAKQSAIKKIITNFLNRFTGIEKDCISHVYPSQVSLGEEHYSIQTIPYIKNVKEFDLLESNE